MTSPAFLTERDLAGAFELLSHATDEPTVLAVLTDEELLALEGTEGAELAGSPFLEASDFDREQAAAVAARSLIARGLVTFEDTDRENEGEDLLSEEPSQRAAQLDRSLAGLLALRSMPRGVLNLTRQVEAQTTSLMIYLFPRDGVLEELVTADGFHHFSLPTRAALPARIARYVDQAQVAAEQDGETHVGGAAEFDGDTPIAKRLRDTRALTVITSASARGSQQHSVMATSDAVFIMDTPTSEDEQVTLREISGATLEELLDQALPTITAQ